MEKIKILYIIDTFLDLAGAERNLFEVVTRINKCKFEPFVFALDAGSILNIFSEKGIFAKNLHLKKIYGFKAIIKSVMLIRFILKNRIDIIVTYHESSDFWGGFIAWLFNIPVVISSRRDMGYKLNKRHRLVYRYINKCFDKIITVSESVKNNIYMSEGVAWNKLFTIYNGVDLELFSNHIEMNEAKQKNGIKNNTWPVIGILAGLRPVKGHEYFIKAASIVKKEFPNVYFLIAGEIYDKPYFENLKKMVSRLELQENIVFTEKRSDPVEILSIFNISVLSSVSEGFSNALVESMAAGKPVIATSVGGNPEAIINGKTGFLVPPKDEKAIAQAILAILKNDKLAQDLSAAARRRVKENFSVGAMISNLENLYLSLFDEKNSKKMEFPGVRGLFHLLKFNMNKIIKLAISNFLYYSGLLVVFRKVSRADRSITILGYHKVNNQYFDYLGMNVNVDSFERQLIYLKRKHTPITLAHAVELITNRKPIPRNAVVVTFDDGYQDNYSNAFPLLKKYGIPATIFLTVNAIDRNEMLWFDVIIEAVKLTNKSSIDLTEFELGKYSLSSELEKLFAIGKIVKNLKQVPAVRRENYIYTFVSQLSIDIKLLQRDNLMLNWSHVNEMARENISFGNHGMDHGNLASLTEDELRSKIFTSKEIIKNKAGIETNLFAYPFGEKDSFNLQIENAIKDNGYVGGCTLESGLNDLNTDIYRLKRICITRGAVGGLFTNFSKALFAAEISGVFDLFRDTFRIRLN